MGQVIEPNFLGKMSLKSEPFWPCDWLDESEGVPGECLNKPPGLVAICL